MKKRSFFERLAGNLRFNETDEDIDDIEEAPAPRMNNTINHAKSVLERNIPTHHAPSQRRELPISAAFVPEEEPEEKPILRQLHEEEEVGQLPVDVYETPREVIIQTLIAGVLPEHLTINITRDVVSISGKREENKSISQDSYHIQELYWGSFERVVDLPVEVEIDNAEAIERHGLLMIKLPKLDKSRKAALKIKSI
jgi:HSP20 family protein